MDVILLIILLFTAVIGLISIIKIQKVEHLQIQQTMFNSSTNTVVSNDVYIEVVNPSYDESIQQYKLTVNITNNSENPLYLTGNGIYITTNTKIIYSSMNNDNLPLKFYGECIKAGETISGQFTFDNVENNPQNIVLSNLNDTSHTIWTCILDLE